MGGELSPAEDAEEVLQAVVPDERVALDVEEEVAGRRLGQQGQATPRLGIEDLVRKRSLGPGPHLEARLAQQALPHGPAQRSRQAFRAGGGDVGHGVQACVAQGRGVRRAHACDQGEVVLLRPLGSALRLPTALPAVAHRLGGGRLLMVEEVEQFGSEAARVGGAVLERIVALGTVTGDHDQGAWGRALQCGEPFGVDGHLQHGRNLEPAGEFGVGDVIAPAPPAGQIVAAEQEVGVAAPAAVEEGGLVDHLGAAGHGLDRLPFQILERFAPLDPWA